MNTFEQTPCNHRVSLTELQTLRGDKPDPNQTPDQYICRFFSLLNGKRTGCDHILFQGSVCPKLSSP